MSQSLCPLYRALDIMIQFQISNFYFVLFYFILFYFILSYSTPYYSIQIHSNVFNSLQFIPICILLYTIQNGLDNSGSEGSYAWISTVSTAGAAVYNHWDIRGENILLIYHFAILLFHILFRFFDFVLVSYLICLYIVERKILGGIMWLIMEFYRSE